ncbi:MAG: hypothetical protein ACE5JG_03465 [Planctomycetota bacterium]
MRGSRLLPAVLAGATLVLIGANAVPTIARKHRLQRERGRLERRIGRERRRAVTLRRQFEALRHDRFVLERWARETWHVPPPDAVPLRLLVGETRPDGR